MAQTVSVDTKTMRRILTSLEELKQELKQIREKLFETEPPYGSDEWWEWSDKKALEEIKEGKGLKFKSAKEAIKWLNS